MKKNTAIMAIIYNVSTFMLTGMLLLLGHACSTVVDDELIGGDNMDEIEDVEVPYLSEEPDVSDESESVDEEDTEIDERFDTDNVDDDDVLSEYAKDCIAPERDEYMARFGVTREDKDLTDPNVLLAKQHTILFIFDKSGSMSGGWNDAASKWDVARQAMTSAVSPFQEYVSAGSLFFPVYDDSMKIAKIDSGQQIDFTNGSGFLVQWDDKLEELGAMGGTPLMDTLEVANHAIGRACSLGYLDRPFKIVLLTDGEPDYYDRERALELFKNWFEIGIETVVMGLPGSSNAQQLLADIAAVGSGGTAEEIMYDDTVDPTVFSDDLYIAIE